MSTDRAAYLPDANTFAGLRETLFRAPEFVEHQRELQTERDWFRMHAMAPPNHRSHFEPPSLLTNCGPQRFRVIQKDVARFRQLHCERRVQNI